MIPVGLVLTPIVILLIIKANNFKTRNLTKIIFNILLLIISFAYLVTCFIVKLEPFNFEINSIGDSFVGSIVIFVFTPFLWAVFYHYCRMIFKKILVFKKSRIKNHKEYLYYRDDLNKISPNMVMFTSIMDVDLKKSVTATILKLRLTGYIEENNGWLELTGKNRDHLLESEIMVLDYVGGDKFNKGKYKKLVKEECLNNKYIIKNNNFILKIFKIIITILIPIVLMYFTIKLDDYAINNYEIYNYDGIRYLKVINEKEVEQLKNEVKDINDYYHSYWEDGDKWLYNYSVIRADKFKYSVVKRKVILDVLVPLLLLVSLGSILVCLFKLLEQIITFNKDYRRTSKGNELLNKAYALKNYLKDFSIIDKRTEKELVLWEYYLIYAVILDINVKVTDEVIKKYINEI